MNPGPPPSGLPSPSTAGVPTLRGRVGKLRSLIRAQPVRSAVVLGALLLIAVAGAPLAALVWELFWSLPHAGRVALCGIGVVALAVATAHRADLPWHRWRRRAAQARLGSLIAIAWVVVIALVVVLVVGAWWVMGAPALDFPDTVPPRALDALATRAFAIVAGLGAAALLVIHYRRQRTTEADAERAERAAEREIAKLFTDSFDSASDKLGNEHAAVRLAGIHALARLADEAPEGREDLVQMVIDVLCAYLRMPYTPSSAPLPADATDKQAIGHHERGLEFASLREVRHTIIRIIGNHLREPTRWRSKDYDFTGTVFDGGNLTGAVFSGGEVIFRGARFTRGEVSFRGAVFCGGEVDFAETEFSGGEVTFREAEFSGGEVAFSRAVFSGGRTDFRWARFSDGTAGFARAVFSGGEVTFREAEFSGGEVAFSRAVFSGGAVDFGEAEFSGGEVTFRRAEFSGGTANFREAVFSGGAVDFGEAEFSGGEVTFRRAEFSSGEVGFRWARFIGGEANFRGARFPGGDMTFAGAVFSGGTVNFRWARFTGGTMTFARARFPGGTVNFREAEFSSGRADFAEAVFTGGTMTFRRARFAGREMTFRGARFSGGEVDFRGAVFSGGELDFGDASGTCPVSLLESIGHGEPEVVTLPGPWRSITGGAD